MNKTTENWLSVATVILNLLFAVSAQNKWVAVVAAFSVAAIGAVYAYFRTDLPTTKPGWKTKAFWASIVVIIGSAALNLSQASIPGLSAEVTKYATMIASVVAAAGYTLIRVESKKTELLLSQKAKSPVIQTATPAK